MPAPAGSGWARSTCGEPGACCRPSCWCCCSSGSSGGWCSSRGPPTLRGDVLATTFYVANWRFAFSGQGYFASFNAPSPLLHTWSLSVEEQFYLLWPLVVILLLRKRRNISRWATGLVALAFVSTLLQSLAGVWTDRLYYGTDTRAMPLLLGAALGAWYVRRDPATALAPRSPRGVAGRRFRGRGGHALDVSRGQRPGDLPLPRRIPAHRGSGRRGGRLGVAGAVRPAGPAARHAAAALPRADLLRHLSVALAALPAAEPRAHRPRDRRPARPATRRHAGGVGGELPPDRAADTPPPVPACRAPG